MSRLESERKPVFTIAKDDEQQNPVLFAVPLSHRKQVVDEFDREYRWALYQENEQKKTLEPVNKENTDLAEFLVNARLLYREGEFQLAKEFYISVLKIDIHNELALRGSAECASAMGQYEEAIEILIKLSQVNKSAHNFKILGDELYAMEYYQDAIQSYLMAMNHSLVESEELFKIYKNMGNAFLKLGDENGAEEYYNKAYTLQPESDTLLVNFASLAVYRGDFERALARFREAVKINDKNDKGWVGLAMIHREYGDAEISWANLEKALDLNPLNPSAIRLVCDWALKDNEIEKAIMRLSSYIEVEKNDSQILMWLAKFLYFDGRLEAAQARIETALSLNSSLDGGLEVLRVIREEINLREVRLK